MHSATVSLKSPSITEEIRVNPLPVHENNNNNNNNTITITITIMMKGGTGTLYYSIYMHYLY